MCNKKGANLHCQGGSHVSLGTELCCQLDFLWESLALQGIRQAVVAMEFKALLLLMLLMMKRR